MPCLRGCCDTQLDHYRSVSISPAATPTRSPNAARINATEKRWEKDHAAYRALRKDGIQPKTSVGAAELQARAESKVEIESGTVLNKQQKATYEHLIETDVT